MAQEKDNADGDNGVPAAQDPAREVAKAAASSRPVRKSASNDETSTKKDHATPKQRAGGARATRKRTTPVSFVRESADELRKVVTPTRKQLFYWSLAVFIFVALLMVFVTAMDFGLGKLSFLIFG